MPISEGRLLDKGRLLESGRLKIIYGMHHVWPYW